MIGFGKTNLKFLSIAVAAFVAGASIFASPVPPAIAAVIATDVQCTGCVGASDLANSAVTTTKLASNSVNGGKISDGTISAADLGPDSVGASELKGITKFTVVQCGPSTGVNVAADQTIQISCSTPGVESGDYAVAENNYHSFCFNVQHITPQTDKISLDIKNECTVTQFLSATQFGVLVFDN